MVVDLDIHRAYLDLVAVAGEGALIYHNKLVATDLAAVMAGSYAGGVWDGGIPRPGQQPGQPRSYGDI